MVPVRITVEAGTRDISIDELTDKRLAAALRAAGDDIARQIARIRCPAHDRTASHLRVHFDVRGGADLQYDCCCERLGRRIRSAMG
jgi:hypothetical protein